MNTFFIKVFTLLVIGSISFTTVHASSNDKSFSLIKDKVKKLETSLQGKIGLFAIDTANNKTIKYRASERFPMQSTFKVMAVSALLKKSETNSNLLQQKINYTKQDLVFWSPITEKNIKNGMTLFDLCAAAIMYSDNTATNIIVKNLGGPGAVNKFARSIGDNIFKLKGWEPNLNSNPSITADTSTPAAMGYSLQKLVLGNALTSSKRELLLNWMKGNTTGDTRIRAGVPQGWIVADKTGTGDDYGISNDIGLIWPPNGRPIVIVIFTGHANKDTIRRDDILVSTTRTAIDELVKKSSAK